MKKLLILTPLLMLSLSFAQETIPDSMCEVDSVEPEIKMRLPQRPSWFISPDPDGEFVGVIMNDNFLVSLTETESDGTAKRIRVPGGVDPVVTPDTSREGGGYLTTPGGNFYSMDEVRRRFREGDNANNVSADARDTHEGYYQSVGHRAVGDDTQEYIYISDPNPITSANGLSYTVSRRDDEGDLDIERRGLLCPGVRGNTPMISKDGRHISIMTRNDDGSMTTKIFALGENQERCDQVLDVGFPTGKVSFDFNSNPRQIAFHIDQYQTNNEWFPQPNGGISKDSYVMDIEVQNPGGPGESWEPTDIRRINITSEKGAGTYYPRFMRDGRIVALEADPDRETFYLSVFEPDDAKSGDINLADARRSYNDNVVECRTPDRQLRAIYGVASLWMRACKGVSDNLRYKDALLITPYLNGDACRNLVESQYEEMTEVLRASEFVTINYDTSDDVEALLDGTGEPMITREEALAVCSTDNFSRKVAETQESGASGGEETDEMFMISKCGGCHNEGHPEGNLLLQHPGGGANFTDLTNGSKGINPRTAYKSIRSVVDPFTDQQMPPPENSTGEQTNYLEMNEQARIARFFYSFLEEGSSEKAEIDALLRNRNINIEVEE